METSVSLGNGVRDGGAVTLLPSKQGNQRSGTGCTS